MSTKRISPEAGFVNPSQLPKGANGRALCRRCATEVPKGRRSWCSDECVDAHRMTTDPAFVRHKLFLRDAGVCASCGEDTVTLVRSILWWFGLERQGWNGRVSLPWSNSGLGRAFKLTLETHRIDPHRISSAGSYRRGVWDADHIVPVKEGGGECGLENYQTLCQLCHKQKTADQAADAAFHRKYRECVEDGSRDQLDLLMDTDPLR